MSGSTIAVIAFLLIITVQRVLETFARRAIVPGERRMLWSFYAFFTLHTVILIGAVVEFWFLRRDELVPWVSALGVLLYISSVVLRNVAIRTLGKFWSLHVEIRREHQLVREGIYRYVRHPAYAAIILEILTIPLVVNAWWTMAFAAVTYVPILLLRLRREEQALVEKFGQPYRDFQREVGALLPRWSSFCGLGGSRRNSP